MRANLYHKFAGVMIALPLIASISDVTAQAPTETGVPLNQINYSAYLPNDTHYNLANDSMRTWNRYLIEEGDWLFGYRSGADGNPIRNRLPKPRNGISELGVLTSSQMATQGFQTWESLGANGLNIQRVGIQKGVSNVILENDTLINPAIANDEHRFRRTLTHQLGHAVGLSDTTHNYGVMYPGTDQQPPNYLSPHNTRMYDLWRARNLLTAANATQGQPAWPLRNFAEMAIWSQTHANAGQAGPLLMTNVTPRAAAPGQIVAFNHIHVENLGNQNSTIVALTAYLSNDPVIGLSDRVIGSVTWPSGFPGHSAWSNGSLNLRIPADIPAGTYYVGLKVTEIFTDADPFNNTIVLTGDQRTNFAPIRMTITN